MSFLVNLAKRKKTPEQLVRSALDNLLALPLTPLDFHHAESSFLSDYEFDEDDHDKTDDDSGTRSRASSNHDHSRNGAIGSSGCLGRQGTSSSTGMRRTPSLSSMHSGTSHGDEKDEYQEALMKVAKRSTQMKVMLYGDGEKEADKDKGLELAEHIVREDLMTQYLQRFLLLPFETKKDVAQIFNHLCHHNLAGFAEPRLADDYFTVVIDQCLIKGYRNPENAVHFGPMLREAIRFEKVARRILMSEQLWIFFDVYVHERNFDVSSDSFATLRELLMRHKALASEFLETNYDQFVARYHSMLNSSNYFTRRTSLKLLGELLLDRSQFQLMIRYISSKENLKAIMNLLRDKSSCIQFEAFHVFKIFVAYPKKPAEVCKILVTNRDKLIAYLENCNKDRDDEQFREEKAVLVATLKKVEYTPPVPSLSATSSIDSTAGDIAPLTQVA